MPTINNKGMTSVPSFGAPAPAGYRVENNPKIPEFGVPRHNRPQGRGGLKRHRKKQRDMIDRISKASIRRIARRGGVKRIAGTIYADIREIIFKRTREIVRRCVALVENRGQKTVTAADVTYALRSLGTTLYGFSESAVYNDIR